MNQRRLGIVTFAAIAVIAIVAVVWYVWDPTHQLRIASQVPHTSSLGPSAGKAQAGQPAPEFAVSTTAGLFDLKKADKPVFLEVFATWCPHCQRETTVIDKLYQEFKSQIDFVGVSGSNTAMDGNSPASQLDVLDWAQRFKARYPVAYDGTLSVANLYLQGGFPTIVIIDKNKTVAYINSGELSYDELKTALEKVL